MSGPFCKWTKHGDRTECHRCGSVCYDGNDPTCPTWITRSEPDGARHPHIKTAEQNHAAYQAWIDAQDYKKPPPPARQPHL